MEAIYINRLRLVAKSITKNVEHALRYINDPQINTDIKEAELIRLNLETCIKRFSAELLDYCQLSNEPPQEELSYLSEIQLKGEETVNELTLKMQQERPSRNQEVTLSAKLPRFELPHFEGNPLEWPSFWDSFVSSIDSKHLSDVDKLMYLKSALRGVAKEAIEGLEMRSLNYQIAIGHLKERFGNDSLIIDSHYSALYKLRPAETTQECRKTLNEIEKHLRILQSLGENVNHNTLRFILIEKFPEEIVYEVRSKSTNYTIDEMRKQLERIISSKEDASRIKERKEEELMDTKTARTTTEALHVMSRQPQQNRNNSFYDNRTRTENNNQDKFRNNQGNNRSNMKRTYDKTYHKEDEYKDPQKRSRVACAFCDEIHYSDSCEKFQSIDARQEQITMQRLCYNCLRKGHRAIECRRKVTCYHCKQDTHNRALCPKRFQRSFKKKEEKDATKVMFSGHQGSSTILQTAIVNVTKEAQNGENTKVRTLLDSGSERTYITQELMNKLHLPVEEENLLSVFTFGSSSTKEYKSPLVRLFVQLNSGDSRIIYANVVPMITHSVPHQKFEGVNKKDLADDGSLGDQVDFLIGNDYYFTFISTEKQQLRENLFLVKSEFGWMLSGKTDTLSANRLSIVTYVQTKAETKFKEPDLPINETQFKTLFDLETIGITDSPTTTRDEEAIKSFNETTRIINNRYTICWPWNEYPPKLSPNLGLAYGRLTHLIKRLDNATLQEYDQTLKEQLKKGIIEVVPHSFQETTDHPVHYLPHHCVKQPGKNLRIVYDASTKTKDSKSLNECLHRGPILLEDLTGLILRFRKHRIGLTADVEKAFLQIALQDKDKDVTRFLWLKDRNKGIIMENIQCLRFQRVPFGIISSPFLLNATIKHHLTHASKDILKQIANDIYVDNLVTGTETLKQAVTLYKGSKTSFKDISMNLREWCSNSAEFMKKIPDSDDRRTTKVLGLGWNTNKDTLNLRQKDLTQENTMRGILKVTASIFDPCGFGAPMLLPAKLIIQELWNQKRKWDEILPEEMINKWKAVTADLQILEDIEIPRPYKGVTNIDNRLYELHCFSDSSLQAYAAVVYLRVYQTPGSQSFVSFVIGKSRVASIKIQTELHIPRLELLGAVIGSRLLRYAEKHLQLTIQNKYLWIDSEIVLSWINSKKLLQPFISNRIKEINKTKDLVTRYIPTEMNPADKGTRPTNTVDDNNIWITGPQFLRGCPNLWPTAKPKISDTTLETIAFHSIAREDLLAKKKLKIPKEINMVLEKENNVYKGEIKKLQLEHYPEESRGVRTQLANSLDLFLDIDNIIRCKGRLTNTNWSYEKKYPILLPKNCEFTNDRIREIHEKNYHVGENHTLSILRQQYWIPQGRVQVKMVLKKCTNCVKQGGGPYKLPQAPSLPKERVNYSDPYTYTGIDYLGPLFVKAENQQRKRWICLFTCMAVRAIHLEVVNDLTAEECLLALKRFSAMRGLPQLIVSDNAPQFKLISEVLQSSYCSENNIKWRFIPQLAAWYGGFYERLVGLVKHCLKRTIDKHLLNDCQLTTVIKEIEAVLNSRPLTNVGPEPEHILTPNDFLNLRECLPPVISETGTDQKATETKRNLIEAWRKGQKIVEEYKEMFVNQYLMNLRERYAQNCRNPRITSQKKPEINDIVQIRGENKNRQEWKVGKIIELMYSKDNNCRVANVLVGKHIFTRSIGHLYPLEVDANPTSNHEPDTITVEPITMHTDDHLPEDAECDGVDKGQKPPIIQHIEPICRELDEPCVSRGNEKPPESRTTNDERKLSVDTIDNPKGDADLRPKRQSASRALEKIREWTRDLTSVL